MLSVRAILFIKRLLLHIGMGSEKIFYDTWTDFVGGANYDLTPDKLQEQMEKGYAFFDMISHGTRNGFSCEGRTSYTTDYASTLQNPRYNDNYHYCM